MPQGQGYPQDPIMKQVLRQLLHGSPQAAPVQAPPPVQRPTPPSDPNAPPVEINREGEISGGGGVNQLGGASLEDMLNDPNANLGQVLQALAGRLRSRLGPVVQSAGQAIDQAPLPAEVMQMLLGEVGPTGPLAAPTPPAAQPPPPPAAPPISDAPLTGPATVVSVNGEELPDPSSFETPDQGQTQADPAVDQTSVPGQSGALPDAETVDIDVTDQIASGPARGAVGDTPNVPADPATEQTITIERGDTLWDLAKKHLGDPRRYVEIAELNGIDNPDLIYAGRTLRIPPA